MRNVVQACMLSVLMCGVAIAQEDPRKELADAYAKLDALKTYRERITFKPGAMGMADVDEMEVQGELGNQIKAMMAPFKGGISRENVGRSISRLYWSFPNPSPIGSEITVEMVEQGNRIATRYDDAKMRAAAAAINAAAQAAMAADNAIATARAIAGAALNPFGAVGDLMGRGMQAAGAARAAAAQRANDMGKWVCSTDEPVPDKAGNAPVKLEKPGTVGGKPVRRYRVFAPAGEEEFARHIVSVDVASGLPVQVEVLNEESDQVFTVIEFYDFDAPITLQFPTCDKER
jgi:hypothetical protein